MISCQNRQTQNAVEGIDTNVVIICEHDRQSDAPFWRINDEVFDLFHVSIYFRVDSYSFLIIPNVHHLFNGSTFQCVLTDHTTDPVSEIPGRITELRVVQLDEGGHTYMQQYK